MSTTTLEKIILKKEKSNLENEISSLKKVMHDYKVESKANWKIFKNKIHNDMNAIEKSLIKVTPLKNK